MLRGLKTKVFYPYPPQQVWRVLTERRSLAAWLMDNDFEPCIGHKFQFRTRSLPGLDGVISCEVLEIDAPKRLAYTWQDSYMSQPSIAIWTLIPVDGGTPLQLEHRELSYVTPQLQKLRTCNQRSRSPLTLLKKGGDRCSLLNSVGKSQCRYSSCRGDRSKFYIFTYAYWCFSNLRKCYSPFFAKWWLAGQTRSTIAKCFS